MHRHAVGLHLVRRLVEDEVPGLVHRRSRPAARADRPPQDRLHARDELLWPERLGDVVVGAELQPAEDVALVLARREQEDGDVLVGMTDALEHDEARELGQVDIEDHEVGLFTSYRVDRGLAVVGPSDVVSLTAERVFEELDEVAIVIDDEELQSSASNARCRAFGSVKCTDVPRPGSLWMAISPPCA